MATLNFFNQFFEDLANGVHDFEADAVKLYLTNTAPDAAADAVKADLAEIATGGGYSGPITLTPTFNRTGGTLTVSYTDVTVTATAGGIAAFRYAVLMNDTPTSPADPLIGWWDRGSSLALADTESVDLDFTGAAITVAVAA